MSEKKILVLGKEIDYGEMSDKKLLSLYNQLVERQMMLEEKAQNYIEKARGNDININNINL